MLEVEALAVSAGTFQLRDVHLSVADGECHAVIGPSGAGKTTLLNALLGLLPVERGSIRLEGLDITRVPVEQRGLGYLPQRLGLFPHLVVRENLAYSAHARGIPKAQFQPLVDHLVERTGIGALLDRYPGSLSGGESQRVSLVRALASRPRLVLLDEPFNSLNESLRREIWWLVRELQQEQRVAVLLVSHDLTETYALADRITVLLNGRVVEQGEKADVYGRPAAADTARFLGIETLQPGRVVGVSDGLATVEVATARLIALAQPGMHDRVLVSIRGEDVALERRGGEIGSARNRLAARIVSVRLGSPLIWVELDVGFPLSALITRPAFEDLGVRPGAELTAVIKAPAVHLIGQSVHDGPLREGGA